MMEHNTDRLFWTLSTIIVGALLLTISVKVFPGITNTITAPLSHITQQAGDATNSADQAFNDATNASDPDAKAKANAVEASDLNLNVQQDNDGTGTLMGLVNNAFTGKLDIPKYVKVNGKLTKITSITHDAFVSDQLTSVNIPDGVTTINPGAFASNSIRSVTIPSSVTYIGSRAFNNNTLSSVNIPNQTAYQSAKSNNAFDSNVTLTNNASN